eukprot:5734192-Pyramimonas_sp.AAC.1
MEQRLAESRRECDKLLQRLSRELDKHDKWKTQLHEHEDYIMGLRAELEIMDTQHAELARKLAATGKAPVPEPGPAPARIKLEDLVSGK